MRLSAPRAWPRAYARGIADEGADVLDVGMVGTEMLYWTRRLARARRRAHVHRLAQPEGLHGREARASAARSRSRATRASASVREIVTAGRAGTAGGRPGQITTEDRGRRLPRGRARVHRPDADHAAEGGARRRQRHGGSDGRARCSTASRSSRCATYWEPDGEFPDHEPNPLLEENRRFIIEKVRETGADLGIAWDGDADRCFFIDDTGRFVDGDFLTALLAESILRKEPGADDPLRRARLARRARHRGGAPAARPLVNRVGHAFFKTRMRETGAAFGGEVSGHYYFHDFYCADSGTIPALLILELLSVEGKRLSELLEPLRSTLLHLGRDQLRGGRPGREDGGDRGALLGRRRSATSTASRSTTTTGTSTCAPRTPSRCCA